MTDHSAIHADVLRRVRLGRDRLTQSDLNHFLLGHSAFQLLRAGCELGVFELLRERGLMTKAELDEALGLGRQPFRGLLLGLRALGLLVQTEDERLANSFAIEALFATDEWRVFKATVRFEAEIVYPGQTDFVESLRAGSNTGVKFIEGEGQTLYEKLATNPPLARTFYEYMGAWSEMTVPHMLAATDLGDRSALLDVGGGDGANTIALLERYPQLRATLLDLPGHTGVASARFAEAGLGERAATHGVDLHAEGPAGELPGGHDVALLAHQTVIWSEAQNTALLRKIHRALEPGGLVIIFCSVSSEQGDGPFFSAMIAAYFLSVAAGEGMIYSPADYRQMLEDAGFGEVQATPCDGWTPHAVVTARKR